MSNLTSLQQGLIDGLIKEFTKINPKPSTNGAKRFSFDTIAMVQGSGVLNQTYQGHVKHFIYASDC